MLMISLFGGKLVTAKLNLQSEKSLNRQLITSNQSEYCKWSHTTHAWLILYLLLDVITLGLNKSVFYVEDSVLQYSLA